MYGVMLFECEFVCVFCGVIFIIIVAVNFERISWKQPAKAMRTRRERKGWGEIHLIYLLWLPSSLFISTLIYFICVLNLEPHAHTRDIKGLKPEPWTHTNMLWINFFGFTNKFFILDNIRAFHWTGVYRFWMSFFSLPFLQTIFLFTWTGAKCSVCFLLHWRILISNTHTYLPEIFFR